MQDAQIVVIGAGAAGMMAAAAAGARARRVLLLEHTDAIGAKILISGGGRCNFTNLHVAPDRFLSQNPHFAKSALARFTQHDFIDLVRRHGVAFYEKTLGQLFCEGTGAARSIVAMLVKECCLAGVEIRTGVTVAAISKADRFRLETSQGDIVCDRLIIATGGLSVPKIGATDFAHRVALRFGLPVVGVRPGLVPLTFGSADLSMMQPLAGVSLDAAARADGPAFREALLFTHRGLSGPTILQISSYWRAGEAISIDLLPGRDGAAWLMARKRARPKARMAAILDEALPQRFAATLARRWFDERPMADWRDQELVAAAQRLGSWRVAPTGTQGYAKAEVTCGGVDTRALSSRTMEAPSAPGLYFVGEAVDVTGWLGGYNFQWAWSSGWAAGQAAAGSLM